MTGRSRHERTPGCEFGYTDFDLFLYFGALRREPHSLWTQLRGQTGMICDKGCAKGGPHGFVSYVSDVEEWARGEPVSDW